MVRICSSGRLALMTSNMILVRWLAMSCINTFGQKVDISIGPHRISGLNFLYSMVDEAHRHDRLLFRERAQYS